MSSKPIKPRIARNKPLFHLQDKKADESELSIGLIKSAKRTGQLSLCNRGLGSGKILYLLYKPTLYAYIFIKERNIVAGFCARIVSRPLYF